MPAALSRRLLVGAALASPLIGCSRETKSWPFQYRLKVVLSAHGGERAGATIFRTVYRRVSGASLNQDQRFSARAWGEAIPIDIGGGAYLFALQHSLVGEESRHAFDPVAERLFVDLVHVKDFRADEFISGKYYEMARQLRGEIELPHMYWPLLVYFDDPADKSTASVVSLPEDPPSSAGTRTRSLESLLGVGARVEHVTIEYTDEPVTHRLQQLLPWVDQLNGAPNGPREWDSRGDRDPLPQRFEYRHFVRDGASR